MEHYVWLALVATLGTWFVTALGAATVAFFKSPSAKALNLMLGFSSGVMIAASFWSLLEPAIAHIARFDILAPHGIIVAEHPAEKTLPALSAPYRVHRTYRYGKIGLTIYRRGGNEENEEQNP